MARDTPQLIRAGGLLRGEHGAPDVLGVVALLEGLVHGSPAERREDLITRIGIGVCLPEELLHPSPELRQPHPHETRPLS